MVSSLVDPVFVGLALLLVGLGRWSWARPRRKAWGWKASAWAGFALLWVAASSWCANPLLKSLQPSPVDLGPALDGVEPERRAMVVLAGGMNAHYDFVPPVERLGDRTRARLLGGARVYGEQGPFGTVIVSGTGIPFVRAMADYLVILGVPRNRIVLEPQATDTNTNAIHSAALLAERDVAKVVLVTSALHMARSVSAFESAGVSVIPAPVDYHGGYQWRVIPSSPSLRRTARALHEVLGRLEP